MMQLTYEEKINFMSSLNWDCIDKYDDMLAVIEGRLERSAAFTRDRLFVRSLERLPWHYMVALWGVETIKEMYTEDIAKRIWPKGRRRDFDFALAVLRREPLPPARWGDEYFKQMWRPVFSDRWYRIEQSIL